TNIEDIKGSKFDLVVCAGAPAQKWLANKEPLRDAEIIGNLISCLNEIDCEMFILISTVDVFKEPIKVDEDTQIETQNLHAYGLN
ncbi:pyridine nucleotide transhydrogenase, partial [Klebsiella oxytoca]